MTTRPNQHISTFRKEEDGSIFVSFGNSGSSVTYYLTERDACDLLVSLKATLERAEEKDYIEQRLAVLEYQATLKA